MDNIINNNYHGLAKEERDMLEKTFNLVNHIHSQNHTIMATLAELQQAVTDLQASIDAKQAAIAQAIADLEAKIAEGAATPEELQGIVDSLKAAKDDIDSTPTA